MAQVTINDGDTGLNVRNALNGMFTELYGNITQPLKFKGQAANFSTTIPANTFVSALFVALAAGGPVTVRIGLTPNGTEISGDISPDGTGLEVGANQNFPVDTLLYFTITGGMVNIRINVIPNFY
jgi:hypothetical protein